MVRVWSGAEKCRTDAERQLAQSQHARVHRERSPGHPLNSRAPGVSCLPTSPTSSSRSLPPLLYG